MDAPEGFADYTYGLDQPAIRWFNVVPHDTNPLVAQPRCLYVGGAGDVAITNRFGDVVTMKNVPAGSFLPVRPDAVMFTGTSATNIVAMY